MRFKLYTLIDITETGARKGDDSKMVKQQQNYLTVLQTIGLRVNPKYIKKPKIIKEVPSELGLGTVFKNKQNVWEYQFEIEYEEALSVETLIEDFNLIPFIIDLDETVEFDKNVFITKNSKNKNIIFIEEDK